MRRNRGVASFTGPVSHPATPGGYHGRLGTTAAGYALSRRQFRGEAFCYAAILAGIMIPPQALIVPLFREFQIVHLINTYWALILPQVPAPIAVFIFKKFFDGVPISLELAAEVDGARASSSRYRLGK